MRKVRHKEEAKQLVSIRDGWSYVFVKVKRKLPEFEAAPF